ncbi:hypothetical protein AAFF_G00045760 [Aldrovandia affinis]|uniref:Uncharacterized protein n=1 Tax=Aldrovandia affinis TaxID=143900 RepID=A0AAD7R1V3_9TELE|nr:hypothetical protein AAFF_G00045760 [Aldrovandia affinis]
MVQKLLRLDWGRPLGSQPLPRSLTLLLVPPRARWWDLNTIDIVLWLQDIASRQTDIVEGRAGGDPRQGRRFWMRDSQMVMTRLQTVHWLGEGLIRMNGLLHPAMRVGRVSARLMLFFSEIIF